MSTSGENNEIQLNKVIKSVNPEDNSVHKYVLKLKNNENGNLLTVHHTVEEKCENEVGACPARSGAVRLIRIRLAACCFNEHGQFVVIDKRGNIFVFDFAVKRFWKLPVVISKICAIKAAVVERNHYFLGTKDGKLIEIDTEQCRVLREIQVCQQAITCISFADKIDKNVNFALLQAAREAIIVDLCKFAPIYRLDFDAVRIQLKFANFIPLSDEIFTLFTNDALHVWSINSLASLRFTNVIKARERKLRLMQTEEIPEFKFPTSANAEVEHSALPDFTEGNIMCYCFSAAGKLLCFSTADYYLLLLSVGTLEQQHIFRLNNFLLRQCAIMPNVKDTVVVGLTTTGKIVMLDCSKTDLKLLLEFDSMEVVSFSISLEGKLLAVMLDNDEAQVWSIAYMYNKLKAQQHSMEMLKQAFKEETKVLNTTHCLDTPVDPKLTALLTPVRIKELLKEYQCFPARFRALIWCTLLQVPGNNRVYQQLLKLNTPSAVRNHAARIQFKNASIQRAVTKVWSCLAHWCKLFAYSDVIPKLIFPFVKLFPKNSFVVFEIIVTLLLNHFQLWFELHPLEPANYLAMIENILKSSDAKLWEFYEKLNVKAKDYAWPMLANAYSEVLDEEQWLILWDNVIANSTDYLVYITVAYNILQREVVMRLPDKATVTYYFHEQNPIDMVKLLAKANKLKQCCPANLQPSRYIKPLQPVPKNVYPLFLNYPREQLVEQEARIAEIKLEHKTIDARIRQLELEELRMQEKLQEGLRKEEEAKRMNELERAYKETIRREECRIATQRKLLLLYQKEVRQRKNEIASTLEQSEQRRAELLMKTDMEQLRKEIESERLRNDTDLLLAEDQLRNTVFELDVERRLSGKTEAAKLKHKYSDELARLQDQRYALNQDLQEIQSTASSCHSKCKAQCAIDNIEQQFNEIVKEFCELNK